MSDFRQCAGRAGGRVLVVLIDQNRARNGVTANPGQPDETPILDADALTFMPRYPAFSVGVISDKQKCAGIVCLASDKAPCAAQVVFDTVFYPRFAVIGDLHACEWILLLKATQNDPRSVASLLCLTTGKKCEVESLIKRFRRKIRNGRANRLRWRICSKKRQDHFPDAFRTNLRRLAAKLQPLAVSTDEP